MIKLFGEPVAFDEEHPHIGVKADADKQALELLVKACPAGLYKKQDDGSVRFDYAGCLECGTCRILGLGSALEQWDRMSGVRHLSHSGAGVGAGTVGIPARHLWCGVPLRLMLV